MKYSFSYISIKIIYSSINSILLNILFFCIFDRREFIPDVADEEIRPSLNFFYYKYKHYFLNYY